MRVTSRQGHGKRLNPTEVLCQSWAAPGCAKVEFEPICCHMFPFGSLPCVPGEGVDYRICRKGQADRVKETTEQFKK